MQARPSLYPLTAQRGATLLEVLVAILVLSIGLLGIAGLTSASVRYSQGGWARATVASALSDLADRVRSNPSASATAFVAATDTYATQQGASYGATVTDCLASSCTDANVLAAYQLEDWRMAVKRSLPSSAIWVSGSRSTGYQATVMWFDKSFLQSDGKTLDSTPACTGTEAAKIAERSCCPASAAAPAGVRCTNMTIVP